MGNVVTQKIPLEVWCGASSRKERDVLLKGQGKFLWERRNLWLLAFFPYSGSCQQRQPSVFGRSRYFKTPAVWGNTLDAATWIMCEISAYVTPKVSRQNCALWNELEVKWSWCEDMLKLLFIFHWTCVGQRITTQNIDIKSEYSLHKYRKPTLKTPLELSYICLCCLYLFGNHIQTSARDIFRLLHDFTWLASKFNPKLKWVTTFISNPKKLETLPTDDSIPNQRIRELFGFEETLKII